MEAGHRGDKMEANERTPLLLTVPAPAPAPPLGLGDQHSIVRRFLTLALGSTLVAVVLFMKLRHESPPPPPPPPIVDTLTCYSSLNSSRAYASAEALNNNVHDFCVDLAHIVPLVPFGWTRSKTYYPHTPDEYTMTVTLASRTFSFDPYKCTAAMGSIINVCDAPGDGNPMNWKQGGMRVQGDYTYQVDIYRQNRPWPPPTKPRQSCWGWYKFIMQQYNIYGAGWANYDWGQQTLRPAINPCCGSGSLTRWKFEYYDEPDQNGYEWHAWFNTAIGTRKRCFDNNKVQCAAGGPCDSYCGGNG